MVWWEDVEAGILIGLSYRPKTQNGYQSARFTIQNSLKGSHMAQVYNSKIKNGPSLELSYRPKLPSIW